MKILALNPAPAKRKARKKNAAKTAKKGAEKMAKKRRGGAKRGAGRSTKRSYTVVANPRPKRTRRRRRNPAIFSGVLGPVPQALKNLFPLFVGGLGAKLLQRRYGRGSDAVSDWTWQDYAWAGGGVLAASAASKYLFHASQATQTKILEGGLFFIGWNLLEKEIVPKSETATKFLGEDGERYLPGDRWDAGTGETFVLGANGEWIPENRRLLGDVVTPVGPMGEDEILMGDMTERPGPLGGTSRRGIVF